MSSPIEPVATNPATTTATTTPVKAKAAYTGPIDYNAVVAHDPGITTQYNNLRNTVDWKSPWAAQHGITKDGNVNDFAKWWYNNQRNPSDYTYEPAGWGDPAPVAPSTGVDATTPAQTTGTPGAGVTTGSTSSNKSAALNQALSRAKLAVAGKGLNWDEYKGSFDPIYNDIYNSIPDSDTNPNAWFDTNMADTILSGQENQKRSQYRQAANGLTTRVDPHMMDDTINKILGNSSTTAQSMLDAGLKRGQFNETGYASGQTALQQAKEAARAKLLGYSSDIGSKYTDQLANVRTQALNAASGYQLGDQFDLNPYTTQDQDIMNMYQTAGSGELYNLMGDSPLINLGDMRMAAGTAQGAINLNDLDVLDALSKRKSANEVGRGLGSQGAF